MCRVLVRWREKPRSIRSDDKHERTRTLRGDPIVAMDDGHVWGREEGLPNYVSLDMDGVPKEQMRQFIKPEKGILVDQFSKPIFIHKRAYNIELDRLPKSVRDGLRRDGRAAVTWAQVTGHITHKLTGTKR